MARFLHQTLDVAAVCAVLFDARMGFGFWIKLAALAVAIAIVSVIILLLVTKAFVAWGIFGGLLALAIVLMLIGWISDRRRARADMR